ncbi:MAG: chemotaxis response regulator protein-glutamate methylesterase [Geobacter sp.]|nr:MAG: chemotaxis response regulator protein-glutamate methylesterase [Geobacter sp.]
MPVIKVVVVDDSAYNRRAITKMLEGMDNVQVVGYAADGEEGMRRILDLRPDLVTLDLEMPKMDGFTLLRIIMNTRPTPVIVISSRSEDERVFKALELGAVDFIAKPTTVISDQLLKIQEDLQEKVCNVFNLNMAGVKRRGVTDVTSEVPPRKKKKTALPPSARLGQPNMDVIAIGASTGGPPALQNILSAFSTPQPVAVLVSQHMPPGFTKAFAERLNRGSALEIKEATDGDLVRPGRVLVAPGGLNMVFQKLENGEVVTRLAKPSAEDRYVPSVDVMFNSLAGIYGERVLAVVLTGMGNDGSRGVRAVKEAGGQVLAESEESSVVFGMPREAIATGVVDGVAPLDRMAREIMFRCGLMPGLD